MNRCPARGPRVRRELRSRPARSVIEMGRAKRRRAAAVAKTRDKRREARARETQKAQDAAAARKMSPRAYRARRTIGWVLVGSGS